MPCRDFNRREEQLHGSVTAADDAGNRRTAFWNAGQERPLSRYAARPLLEPPPVSFTIRVGARLVYYTA